MARSEYSVGKPSEHTLYTEPDISNMIEDLKFQIRSLKDAIEDHEKEGENRVYEDIDSSRSRRRKKVSTTGYLLKYSVDMGFHWMRYVLQSHVGFMSRLIWFLVLLTCLALVSYQITDRVMKFLSDTTHTNMDLRYVESLEYPDITICNLNRYRITEAQTAGLYGFLHSVVHGRRDRKWRQTLPETKFNTLLNKTYSRFMRKMSHKKECFIHSCTWAGHPCGIQNFTEIFTDYGLCYKFTPSKREIKSGGTSSGLSVVLNVEQYEYLLGPRSAVGVKFAIHDPSVLPQLSTTGYFAPVGSHSSIAIGKIQHLDKSTDGDRWGFSQFQSGHGLVHYTTDCPMQCEALEMRQRCGCVLPRLLPYSKGRSPECSANEYFQCVQLINDYLNCSCSPDCERIEYDVGISHSAMSSYAAESEIRTLKDKRKLQLEFQNARDTYHRMDRDVIKHDNSTLTKLAENFNHSVEKVHLLSGNASRYGKLLGADISNMNHSLQELNNSVMLTAQLFNKFSHLSFYHFDISIKATVKDISESYSYETISPTASIVEANRTLNNIIKKLETLIVSKYYPTHKSTPLIPEITKGIETFREQIVSGYGQKYQEFRESRAKYNKTTQSILNISARLKAKLTQEYKTLTNVTHSYHTNNLRFIKALEQFYQTVELEIGDIMKSLDAELTELQQAYTQDRVKVLNFAGVLVNVDHQFQIEAKTIETSLSQLWDSLDVLKLELDTLQTGFSAVKMEYTQGTLNKSKLALRLSQPNLIDSRRSAEDLTMKVKQLMDNIARAGGSMWELIQPIKFRFADFRLDQEGQVEKLLRSLRSPWLARDTEKVTTEIRKSLNHVSEYETELADYVESTKINGKFYLNNFLQLDVYFSELTETRITQQTSYGLFDLACDVGGSLALYLGISVIAVFEALDFVAQLINIVFFKSKSKRLDQPGESTC